MSLRFRSLPIKVQPLGQVCKRSISTSPFAPRHLLSIADLTPQELVRLIQNASAYKTSIKSGVIPPEINDSLYGQTVALMFTKRSTRTRVSTEAAVARMQGHTMFLGSGDIQLGVNESLYDTSVVISSMVSAIVARVNAHADVADLAKHSQVPVINALSDAFHPLQALADYLTMHEAFATPSSNTNGTLGLEGLKVAWIGDANNVLYDLALAAAKLGVRLSVATPAGYTIPGEMRQLIHFSAPKGSGFKVHETQVPEEAVKDANVIVTDTWISMGRESEKEKRLRDFDGFQVTTELARRGGATEGWRFMHCLPRKQEEVSDEVFYSPASLVFEEAENRLWAAMAALQAFVVNQGKIL
ncbi:ornithine carbamoyltransferase [Piedraia hortae CBS 480.64]|uniref:Ornithine carbamoyltransferase, mitochondrial n=1 Tax=Piedraia hortae CBS 480.64 TaxID=1314780 RepID=A0A6A7C995_9PEZI|nr:ornithine carbamoyltransferase [Piedraia hortae CBS 480.64]